MTRSPGDRERDAILAAIVEDFEVRLGRGEAPDIEAQCEKHPALAEDIRRTLRLVAGFARAAEEISEPSLPGSLGPYRILSPIGHGGMGWVYRARDERLDRDVAIKVLVHAPGGIEERERFRREARAMARIEHPHVVGIHDVGEEDSCSYLAMELMECSVLDLAAKHFDRHGVPPPADVVLDWLVQAADGLACLHDRGVIHRDVKPGNLLVGRDGLVRVSDLGLARLEDDRQLTRTGIAMGTAQYSAPEQLRGEEATRASDVYGLGATAWRLLTGTRPPAHGAPREWPEAIPKELRRVLSLALAPDPAHRQRDARRLADDLRRARRARRVGPRRRVLLALLVVVTAIAALTTWARFASRPGPAAVSASAPVRSSGHVVLRVLPGTFETPSSPPWLAWLRSRGVTHAELESSLGDAVSVSLHGGRHEARLEPGRIALREGARTVATATLPETAGTWRLGAPRDVDGDGYDDVVAGDGRELALVRWDPQELREPGFGWRHELQNVCGQGSVTVADWDGDGTLDVLAGDAGIAFATGLSVPARVSWLRFDDGGLVRAFELPEPIHSTPRLPPSARGVAYVDTEISHVAFQGGGLYALRAGTKSPEPIAVEGTGRLTSAAFVDVDGDGDDEILVARQLGRRDGSDGIVSCLDPSRGHATLWTAPLDGVAASYPVLTQQDADPLPEACFVASRSLRCFDVEPAVAGSRIAWEGRWGADVLHGAQPVEIGDLDGDGFSELAVGSQLGALDVFGRGSPGGFMRRLALPEATRDLKGAWPAIIGRPVALPGAPPGEAHLLAMTESGWLLRWRLTRDSVSAAEPLRVGTVTGTSSPVLVTLPQGRRAVLVLNEVVSLYEIPADPLAEPALSWSSWTCLKCAHGTPAVVEDAEGPWAVFTHPDGLIVKTAL